MHLPYLSERKDTDASTMSQKKTGQRHKCTSLRFLHDCDHLLVCVGSLVKKDAWNKQSYGCTILRTCICLHVDIVVHLIILCLHAWTGVQFRSHAVLEENMKPKADCHHSIMTITMTTDKALSSCRHSGLASAPSAAVASWASECAGMSFYLRAIWSDKSSERDSRATRLPPSYH